MGGALSRTETINAHGIVAIRNSLFATARCKNALERGGYIPKEIDEVDTVRVIHSAIAPQVLKLLLASSATNRLSHGNGLAVDPRFTLKTQNSIDCFGEGVVIEGSVPPGTCVAFFPGFCHASIPASASLESPSSPWFPGCSWEENDKQINRCDGALVDGQRWFDRHNHTSERDQTEFARLDNDFALGHMINHPPKHAFPSVMSWAVDFDVGQLETEENIPRSSIPYTLSEDWYYSGEQDCMIQTPMGLPLPGVVMVTTRRVECGAELLFDYQLGMPSDEMPEWYTKRDARNDFENERQSKQCG